LQKFDLWVGSIQERPAQRDLGAPLTEKTTEEKVRWWRPADLPGVEILEVENSSRLWTVYHDTYALCQLWNARDENFTQWRYRGRKLTTTSGGIMMTEPGEVHVTERLGRAGDFWVIMLDSSWFSKLQTRGFIRGLPRLTGFDASCPQFFLAMQTLYQALKIPTSRLEKETRLLEVMRMMMEGYGEERLHVPKDFPSKSLAVAIDYLRAHFTEEIPLDTLAAEAKVHPCYLDRLFKAHLGIPPRRYQAALRVAEASKDLARGLPLNLIDVGFCNQSHLTRVFKQVTGMTPARYQRSIRCESLPRT